MFLNRSETFVRDHLLFLRRYAPTAVTSALTRDPLEVPGVDVLLAQDTSVAARVRQRLPRRLRARAEDERTAALRTVLARSRPDLVHAHFGSDAAVVVRAATELGLPLVVTWHGYDATVHDEALSDTEAGRLLVARRREVLESSAGTIAVSDFIAEQLRDRGAPSARLDVIPCGVDTRSLVWTPPPTDGGLLFVGRLVPKKGLGDLLEALARTAAPPRLDVVGDGPLRAVLEARAAELELPVTFLGTRSTPEVALAMARATAVVIPSRRAPNGDCEGLPVVSLEAAASGRPVVAYAHSGLRDSVVDGTTGLLAPEGDVDALAAALQRLLGDRDLQLAFSRAGRAHAERSFDIRTTTARIEAVYDRALART